jgi:hypothetical protein
MTGCLPFTPILGYAPTLMSTLFINFLIKIFSGVGDRNRGLKSLEVQGFRYVPHLRELARQKKIMQT